MLSLRRVSTFLSSSIKTSALIRNASIRVLPQVSLVDEPVTTVVEGLTPGKPVHLCLQVTNQCNLHFSSSTEYLPSDSGDLDLATAIPSGHGEADPMLPFWSLKPEPDSNPRFGSSQADDPYCCKYQVVDKDTRQVLAEADFQRSMMGPGVRRVPVKEGRLRGTLFCPQVKDPFQP